MLRSLGITALFLVIGVSLPFGLAEHAPTHVPEPDSIRQAPTLEKQALPALEKLPDGYRPYFLFLMDDNRKTVAELRPGDKVDVIFSNPYSDLGGCPAPTLTCKDLVFVEDLGEARKDMDWIPRKRKVVCGLKLVSVAGTQDEVRRFMLAHHDVYREARVVPHTPAISAEQEMVRVPEGMRAISIQVEKNDEIEQGCVAPGTKLDVLIEDDNGKENGEWHILPANALYLASGGCRYPNDNEEARRRIQETTLVVIAASPQDCNTLALATNTPKVRVVRHVPTDQEK
jgi:hypothetical protein